MLVTLGFTESDRANDYSSFMDGYRLGASQRTVTVDVPGLSAGLSATHIAEALFVGSNAPGLEYIDLNAERAAYRALAELRQRTPLRSLSVGDTVTLHSHPEACGADLMLARGASGWELIAP